MRTKLPFFIWLSISYFIVSENFAWSGSFMPWWWYMVSGSVCAFITVIGLLSIDGSSKRKSRSPALVAHNAWIDWSYELWRVWTIDGYAHNGVSAGSEVSSVSCSFDILLCKSVCNNNKRRKSKNENTQHSILAKQYFEWNSSKFINDEKENSWNGMCGFITTAFSQSHLNESKATL